MSKDERQGFLKPEHEEKLDRLIKLKGIAEAVDGIAIRLADNQGLERLKGKLVEVGGEEAVELTYQIIDSIMDAIPESEEE